MPNCEVYMAYDMTDMLVVFSLIAIMIAAFFTLLHEDGF